jgi:hypothetical protein
MNRYLFFSAILAALLLPGSGTSEEALFSGTFRLVSFTRTCEAGETGLPYGEGAFGRLLYADNGRMAAILMGRDGTRFFAYSGTFTVDEAKGTITHHVEACVDPDWVGSDRVRRFERIGEDRVVLRPVEGDAGRELVWEKER